MSKHSDECASEADGGNNKASKANAKVYFVEIGENEEGQRLDNFLMKQLKGVPKSRIYRILRKGEVRVNKKRAKPSDRLAIGDQVRIPPVRVTEASPAASPGQGLRALLKNSILFEDEALLIIDKPSGLAVHGGSGLSLGVIESLRAMRPKHEFLELVHRLDRETSGCLMLARSRKALVAMHEQMRSGEGVHGADSKAANTNRKDVKKEYLALTCGAWPSSLKQVDAPLQKNQLSSGERIVRVSQEGKLSKTNFSVVEHYNKINKKKARKKVTLVRAQLETGRTHQIRVHAQLSGHALAGDQKYGDPDYKDYFKSLGLKRLFLHASCLEFRHPISGETVSVESSLPEDLQAVLSHLDG